MVNGHLVVLGNLQAHPCLLLGSQMCFQQDSPDFCLFFILLYPAEPNLERVSLQSALACMFSYFREWQHEALPSHQPYLSFYPLPCPGFLLNDLYLCQSQRRYENLFKTYKQGSKMTAYLFSVMLEKCFSKYVPGTPRNPKTLSGLLWGQNNFHENTKT